MFDDISADIVRTRSPSLTHIIQGLGQTPTVQDWLSEIVSPITTGVKSYYDVQAQQLGPQALQVASTTTLPSINPLYLIGGGVLVWWLFRGGVKGKERRRRR
jgi:hypothetical protein